MLTATVIATDDALTLARQEVEAVAAQPCIQAATCYGNLTHERIHAAFEAKRDVVWYAGHMSAEGIPLADGTTLAPVVLGSYIAAFEARLAVLSSCEGGECALAIHNQARRCMVIYWREQVESGTAYHVMALVAAQLCSGGVEAAVNFARGAGCGILQAGMSYQYPSGPSPELLQYIQDVRERLVRMEVTLARAQEDITSLRADVQRIRDTQQEEPVGLQAKQLFSVALGVAVALVALAATIYVASHWGG